MNYGSLQLIQSFPSALVPARPVAIWAPEEYTRDDTTRFPVLYMQDGNMVFQPAAEGSNNWAVPETVTRLTATGTTSHDRNRIFGSLLPSSNRT